MMAKTAHELSPISLAAFSIVQQKCKAPLDFLF